MKPAPPETPQRFFGRSAPLLAPKTCATAERRGKTCHSCKPLPKEFHRDGFAYREILRATSTAIYEQVWIGSSNRCFEVIRVRCRSGFAIGETLIEPYEIYPNSRAWGTDAWTVQDKESAFRKFREVANSQTEAK